MRAGLRDRPARVVGRNETVSAVFALHVSDAIIMAADSTSSRKCSSPDDDDAVVIRQDDTSKMDIVSRNVVCGYVGTTGLTDKTSVAATVEAVYSKAVVGGRALDVRDMVPAVHEMLCKYHDDEERDISCLVTGYAPNGIAHVYYVTTRDRGQASMRCGRWFHYWTIGYGVGIMQAMLKNVDTLSLSMNDGITLARGMMTAIIQAHIHTPSRCVGGLPRLYVMSADGKHVGWVDQDNNIIPDEEYIFDEKGVLRRGAAYGRELC